VIREEPDLWREATRTPQPILAYLIDTQAERQDLRTPEGRKRLVDAVMPTLRRVADPVLRDSYLQVLANRSGVEERVLLESLHQGGRPGWADGGRPGPGIHTDGGRSAGGGTAGPGAGTGAGRITADAVIAARDLPDPEELVRSVGHVEAELLRLLLVVPDEQLRVADRLTPEMFPSELARGLWRGILADREADAAVRDAAAASAPAAGSAAAAWSTVSHAGDPGRFERGRFLASLDEESRALAIALYASRAPIPGVGEGEEGSVDLELVDHGVEQCLLRLELDGLEEQGAWTRGELADAEMRGDADAIARLMDDERRLNEARLSLHRRIEQASLLARTTGGRT
jgi:hypothetical protein